MVKLPCKDGIFYDCDDVWKIKIELDKNHLTIIEDEWKHDVVINLRFTKREMKKWIAAFQTGLEEME